MAGGFAELDPVRHGGAALRGFLNIASEWKLTEAEQTQILGIREPAVFEDLRIRIQAHEPVPIAEMVIIRIGAVLSIYASLGTQLPPDRMPGWLRSPNLALEDHTPLSVMTTGRLEDLDRVARYLLNARS
ncbi:MbcA/ParS/Xre antitoxin family protein [Altericroceibacterium endophyticum]|uniref:DUF2384 domain-containing protein n=1 Tax=Altericroceibacterium endophyticum TaxID=1808508 RepID=A0A6I4T0V2_9SPHN|nr:MbcA/ParS/Xre antitoxin family protein [Altericroceibacterium endophyticum]MXO64548.1 DUF2384 domain-containing protein [Altericroceibacterium endophyticum]